MSTDAKTKLKAAAEKKAAKKSEPTIISVNAPLGTARAFTTVYAEGRLIHQAGVFYRRDARANAWLAREEAEVRGAVWLFLESCRSRVKGDDGTWSTQPVTPKQKMVGEVVDATRGITVRSKDDAPPRWLDERPDDPSEVIAFRNGLLRVSDRVLLSPDPAFYNHVALPFDYAPEAPAPEEWLKFLGTLWPKDDGETALLQEMMGYLISGETSFQKILMLLGPKRSGKGTIARVLRGMLGARNVCGPTLASMGENFGRECLIGKSAAIIADARLNARTNIAALVEELLAISGEDGRSVPRKFLSAWEGTLAVRFLLLTNELPRLEDSSGALASRFVILKLKETFYGREDLKLFRKLRPELPSIINWALDGWDRLKERGHFLIPRSSAAVIDELEALGSPIASFLKDRANVGTELIATRQAAWDAWRSWCQATGRLNVGTIETFSRDLHAALPEIGDRRVGPRNGTRDRCWVGFELRAPHKGKGEDDERIPF